MRKTERQALPIRHEQDNTNSPVPASPGRVCIQTRRDKCSHPLPHRPNQHWEDEIQLIENMRRENPDTGLVVFWVKLRRRGYTRSISGLYRFLRKSGQMAVKLPNPKYIPKPYEQMQYPGQRAQIDVKYVPKSCLVGTAEEGGYYQYTFLDEYSRFGYLEAFQEHSTYSSAQFIRNCVKKFPFPIECVQTDNGSEFTNRLISGQSARPTLFESTPAQLSIRHKLIRPYTPRHNGKVERSHRKDNEEFLRLPQVLLIRRFPTATHRPPALLQQFPHASP